MPRKPRIEIAGCCHIVNRGVEQRVIFQEAEDYEYFKELMCFYAQVLELVQFTMNGITA